MYTSLYTSESPLDSQLFNSFFEDLVIPSIDLESDDSLEVEVTSEEVATALSSTKSGSMPGPDSFPNELYKPFSAQLAPLLCLVFMECMEKSTLPPNFYQAFTLYLYLLLEK